MSRRTHDRHPAHLLARTSAVVTLMLAAAACGPADDVRDADSGLTLSGDLSEQPITVGGISFTVQVPEELGSARARAVAGECQYEQDSFGTTPVGSSDHDPKLFFASTRKGCPDNQALNGGFPSWATTADLPKETTKLDAQAPFASAHGFTVDYTQCTNECYDREYDVVFVTLDDGSTFWMQSSDLDDDVIEEILASFELS